MKYENFKPGDIVTLISTAGGCTKGNNYKVLFPCSNPAQDCVYLKNDKGELMYVHVDRFKLAKEVVDSKIRVGDKVRLKEMYRKDGVDNQYANVLAVAYDRHILDAELPTSVSPKWGENKIYNVCYLEKFPSELSGIHVNDLKTKMVKADSVSMEMYNVLLEQNKHLKTDLEDLASNHHKTIKRMEANIANMTAEHKNEMANARGHANYLKIAHKRELAKLKDIHQNRVNTIEDAWRVRYDLEKSKLVNMANELLAAQKQLDNKPTFLSKLVKKVIG